MMMTKLHAAAVPRRANTMVVRAQAASDGKKVRLGINGGCGVKKRKCRGRF
jgi:hypothetical protein